MRARRRDTFCPGISLILLVQNETFLKMSQVLRVEKTEAAFWSSKRERGPDRQCLCAGMQFGTRGDERQEQHEGARWDAQTRPSGWPAWSGNQTKRQGFTGSQSSGVINFKDDLFALEPESTGDPFLVQLQNLPLAFKTLKLSSHKVSKESLLFQNEWPVRSTYTLEACSVGFVGGGAPLSNQ